MIQSSADVRESGAVLSTAGYRPSGWYRATLPSTVLSALVEDRVYADPYFGMNLRSIAGTEYPISMNFSNLPMPPESPFRHSWWYPHRIRDRRGLAGQNHPARVGRHQFPLQRVAERAAQIADAAKIVGAFRLFEFDVTARPAGRHQHPGDRDIPAAARRFRHHVRGLEPAASRQEHGAVARRLGGRDGAGRHTRPRGHTHLVSDAAELTVRAELGTRAARPWRRAPGQARRNYIRRDAHLDRE